MAEEAESHDSAMELIRQLPTEDRNALLQKRILDARDRHEAQLIFRLRHGAKVACDGWTTALTADNHAVIECFAALDEMLSKYPGVFLLERFDLAPPDAFLHPDVSAHTTLDRFNFEVAIEVNQNFVNRYHVEQPNFSETQEPDLPAGFRPSPGRHGIVGRTVVHEFAHALCYAAYLYQYLQRELDDPPWPEDVTRSVREIVREYPTLSQGRDAAILKALVSAFNREVGVGPDTTPIEPESPHWDRFVSWLQQHVSSYSINEDSEEIADPSWPGAPLRGNVVKDGELNFNYGELAADSFQDVESNGDSASPTSKTIHPVLVQQYLLNNLGAADAEFPTGSQVREPEQVLAVPDAAEVHPVV